MLKFHHVKCFTGFKKSTFVQLTVYWPGSSDFLQSISASGFGTIADAKIAFKNPVGPLFALREDCARKQIALRVSSFFSKREWASMTVQRRFKRMLIEVRDGFHVLMLGDMEIWDGADLALLREGLFRLINGEDCDSIAIDMSYVKYIPSGFFGMLFDWQEKCGTRFVLTPPQPNVQRMLWFRQFFKLNSDGLYEMQREPAEPILPHEPSQEACLSSQSI